MMENLGLNEFLQPVNSPIAQNQAAVYSYQFDYQNERGVVSTGKIKNASITNALIGSAAIDDVNIANGAIVTDKIADGAVTNDKVVSINASKITAGTVIVALNLGTASAGSLILDGANNRIVVHDGTTNRVVIGNI